MTDTSVHHTREPTFRPDYPMRDYIGDMIDQLAALARSQGDRDLAAVLESAASAALAVARRQG